MLIRQTQHFQNIDCEDPLILEHLHPSYHDIVEQLRDQNQFLRDLKSEASSLLHQQ